MGSEQETKESGAGAGGRALTGIPHSAFRIQHSRSAFTLIEMMVVVAIIGLLVAALIPALGMARTSARNAQAGAQIQALATGMELFKAEANLGGGYPPSGSDHKTDSQLINNPRKSQDSLNNGGKEPIRTAGGHLLVHAMLGADFLGTPGFRDLPGGAERGLWWDDVSDNVATPGKEGIYAIFKDPPEKAGQTVFPRYGGAGFVDDKMKERTASLKQIGEKGNAVNLDPSTWAPPGADDAGVDEPLFIDPWDHPILYYRAAPHNIRMVSVSGAPGIYRQEDNGLITGTRAGTKDLDGIDFGPGRVGDDYHDLRWAKSPAPTDKVETILTDLQNWDKTFAKFILDGNSKARPVPVRSDSYLLISAGVDARYGTEDDVVNWTKAKK